MYHNATAMQQAQAVGGVSGGVALGHGYVPTPVPAESEVTREMARLRDSITTLITVVPVLSSRLEGVMRSCPPEDSKATGHGTPITSTGFGASLSDMTRDVQNIGDSIGRLLQRLEL